MNQAQINKLTTYKFAYGISSDQFNKIFNASDTDRTKDRTKIFESQLL